MNATETRSETGHCSNVGKPGFRKTEFGFTPIDWSISTLGAKCHFENGDRGRNYPSPNSFVPDGVPFINAGHLCDGRLGTHGLDFITTSAFNRLGSGKVKPNDFLFCLRGTLGKFGKVSPHFGNGAIASSLVIVRPKQVGFDGNYLGCYFASDLCAQMIEKWAGGAAQPNLGAKDLAQFIIPLPPLPEQRAIAAALSDVDDLLQSLDRLIAKKRDVKQGAMQQLLTGTTRLPGFDGAWETKRLGEIFTIWLGSSKSFAVNPSGSNVVVDMGAVGRSGELIKSKKTDLNIDLLDRGDLIMPKDDIGGGQIIGRVAYIDRNHRYVLGDHVYALRANAGEPRYFHYAINSYQVNRELRAKAVGSAQLGLGRASVTRQLIPFPNPDEQRAIAAVLSDMDAEIDALEARRDKAALIKQGMMQELLTGRTQLPIPQEAKA